MSTGKSRRSFLKSSMGAALAVGVSGRTEAGEPSEAKTRLQPNILVYMADQFRWDFVGANGRNPSTRTPSIDAMAGRGVNFTQAITNQPVCAPARSVMMTSRYATETGVWRNGLALDRSLPTLAGELRKAGYSANMIGKWHLAPQKEADGGGEGFVRPEFRGGFLDVFEGDNEFEHLTHPYEGTIYDADNKAIRYKDQYRVDFLTDRAERFLRKKHDKPFFLFVSQLEPHQQNDMGRPVGPNGSVERFANPFAPEDLRPQPGSWQDQLPDYYGCCESIDTSVGRLRRVLEEEHLAENTIFVFMSDHGCHFMTRNSEYKRSTHNSSIRIPLIFDGPGFVGGQELKQLVGIIDLTPTLLAAAAISAPETMKGRNFAALATSAEARSAWSNEQLIQISESMTGRAIRTPDWTYCVVEPTGSSKFPSSTTYHEYQMYDQRADPHELVNLAGRKPFREKAEELRKRLTALLVAAGEAVPEITPAKLYP